MNLLPKHLQLLAVCGLLGFTAHAQAAGFALIEHGASGMGNAYAGASAVSIDTSTAWFNPAGMTELTGREISVSAHIISSTTDYADQGTALNQAFGADPVSGPASASPGQATAVPNFYYVAPINDKISYGIAIGVPFGSSTEYDDDWRGRYTTINSGVSAIDINPSIAYRVSDKFRLGGGISLQRFSAELGSAVDSGAVCLGVFNAVDPAICINQGLVPGVQENDGFAEVTGDSTAFSFNLGALFLPRPDTKIGIAYRHSISHELEGDADFQNNATLAALLGASEQTSGLFQDGSIKAEIDLPASFSVSVAHQLNQQLQLLGDITWTGWSSFEELRVSFDNGVQPDTVSLQEWEDVLRIAGGVNYQHNEQLVLRAGVALDEEAIPSPQRRTARIPGSDRTWISFGAGYRFSKNASFDFGFAHLFLDETPIDNSNSESAGATTIRGLYNASVNIASVQFNWEFN